jgi:hypothetical protein
MKLISYWYRQWIPAVEIIHSETSFCLFGRLFTAHGTKTTTTAALFAARCTTPRTAYDKSTVSTVCSVTLFTSVDKSTIIVTKSLVTGITLLGTAVITEKAVARATRFGGFLAKLF